MQKNKKAKNQHEDLEISSDDDSDQAITYQLDVDDTDTPDGGPFSLLNLPQSFEDIQKYLTNVWEGLSPPIIEKDITGSLYAAIFENKRRTQLYIGKLTGQFLGANALLYPPFLLMKMYSREHRIELKLKSGGGTDLEKPSIANQSYGIYKLKNIIAGPLDLIPRKGFSKSFLK